jgi:signal transduction histidine kinase
MKLLNRIFVWFSNMLRGVPVRLKIIGIGLIPVVILGLALDYWVTSSLSDWLSHLLIDVRVQAAMSAGRRSVTLVTFLAATMSVFISLFLSHVLSRQILALREMAQKVASGQLEARARVWGRDEIGQLAVAINTMTDHLVSNQKDLVRTNRRLDTINQIALVSDEQTEIHDVLYVLLQKILAAVHLDVGWVYLLDPERRQFHLASWAGVPEDMGRILIHQDISSPCNCQQCVMDGSKETEIEVRTCDCLINSAYTGVMKDHLTIPLEARGQMLGVINLLCAKDTVLSRDDMDLLTSIGAQVSEIVANAWLRLKLKEKELARQALLESLVRAQEEERRRLARELHDGAGQTLTSLLVRLKTLEKKNSSSDLAPALEGMQEIVSQTIEQIRTLSYRLRPAALEEFGLSTALETLMQETAQNSGLNVSCECALEDFKLLEEVEVTLYRITQEGLTNVLRHASASEVRLELKSVVDGIQLCIEDDGVGFDPAHLPDESGKRHLGLVSMRERAEMLGGTLDVYTAPHKGTTIQVFIPLLEAIVS